MKKIEKDYDVGIIIGRFQVDNLHEGHVDLINHVCSQHQKVVMFLGLSPCKCTTANPLDFETRKKMINDLYPDILIQYIKDVHSDELWSKRLDEQIEDLTGANQSVCLYGSRDSFISHYHGIHATVELEQEVFISGTDIRKKISNKTKGSPDFRHGVIWAAYHQWPKAYPTVDVAIFNEDKTKILLGKKPNEAKHRFIGGFVQPGDTLEQSVRRETMEEANIEITEPQYVKSFVVNDWRYRSEMDKITTSLFMAQKQFGKPQPGDDISELRWFDFGEELLDEITDEHKPLLSELIVRMG